MARRRSKFGLVQLYLGSRREGLVFVSSRWRCLVISRFVIFDTSGSRVSGWLAVVPLRQLTVPRPRCRASTILLSTLLVIFLVSYHLFVIGLIPLIVAAIPRSFHLFLVISRPHVFRPILLSSDQIQYTEGKSKDNQCDTYAGAD